MTAELRWIFLLLHFTAAAAGLNPSSVTVRDGAGVTLPCFTRTGDQRRRDGTTWTFAASGGKAAVTVFEGGKFHADVRSKSDRLRVTEKCSLVIEKVSADDAGQYICRQYDSSGRQQVTEQEVGDDDEVTLTCSLRSDDGRCRHSVQWQFDDEDKNKETSQFSCSDSVKIQTWRHNNNNNNNNNSNNNNNNNTNNNNNNNNTNLGLTEQKVSDDDEVMLNCSVRSYDGHCEHSFKGHDDDDDAVTYSTVKAPPPSSSSDHHDLYNTVNKPKKPWAGPGLDRAGPGLDHGLDHGLDRGWTTGWTGLDQD
ncbi:hypothetical protein INR49_018015 [Caranx melampygus]|nr:hypothetical protein INR49_018015 [Caranx melampygus]